MSTATARSLGPRIKPLVTALCLVTLLATAACGGGEMASASDVRTTSVANDGVAHVMALGTKTLTRTLQASAGPDMQPQQGEDLVLLGTASSGTTRSANYRFLWTQVAGPAVVLLGVETAAARFTVPFVTTRTVLSFSLAVTITVGSTTTTATDTVNVTVERDSPWGVAPSAALSYNPEGWLPDMAEAGITTVRGFYRTATIDRLPPITAAGMSGVGFLMWSPGNTLTLPANDLAGWRAYVTDQVTRYKGRVRHWEVWNEPPNFTADTSPASYARVVAAAYDAAKAVDPAVQVGIAAKSNHVSFLAESIAAGAANKFDFITLHPYEVAGFLPQGWEGVFMGIVPGVRKMLADKNPARANAPVWFTEIGIPASLPAAGGVGPDGQGDVLTKIYTMALAQGVARTYWFDPRDSEGLTMGLTDGSGLRRPAWQALKALTTHLGVRPQYLGHLGNAFSASSSEQGLPFYGFVFSGPQGVVLSAWAPPGETRNLSLASEVKVVDPRTGATRLARSLVLGSAPTLLVATVGSPQATQWVDAAAASQGRPFPWGGDNGAATSVTLEAGKAPQGLFLANPPALTTVNGIPEFNFKGRGGPMFALDPTFLSYGTTPVTVKVTLRKLGTESAGFNLKYEADVPINAADGNGLVNSGTGWHNVAGTSLYERTWILPNTRFVAMYGYHLYLDSDGPAYSNFSLQKVTVSRN